MCRHEVGRQEPLAQRQVRSVHDRSGDRRGLVTTACPRPFTLGVLPNALTFPDPRPCLKPPGTVAATLRAFEAASPPFLGQVFRTRVVVGEVRGELLQRWRPILGPTGWKQAFAHPARIAEQGRHVMRER